MELVTNDHNGNGEYKNLWPFILWGALAHTNTSYAKPDAGMDDEILISSNHCDWVYVCHYHNKKECKWNIQRKKGKESENGNEICKPWFCAILPIMQKSGEVKGEWLINNENSRDYLKKEPIKEKYQPKIFCTHKCYLAKLWEYKLKCKDVSHNFPYLFDHPFPNSFYAVSLNNYFENPKFPDFDFISFEAQIISLADEIAQRQQDLEDGITKGLLSFTEALSQVTTLFENFDQVNGYKKKLNNIKNSEYLGKLLTEFYQNLLIEQTKKNVKKFKGMPSESEKKINQYSLMNILYEMDGKNARKTKWILKELELQKNTYSTDNKKKPAVFENYFESDPDPVYLYLICFDYLERFTKRFDYKLKEEMIEILSKCVDLIDEDKKNITDNIKTVDNDFCDLRLELKKLSDNCKNKHDAAYGFIKTLEFLRNYLREHYPNQNSDYFNATIKEWWKNIGQLNLRQFYKLYQIHHVLFKNKETIVAFSDLQHIKIKDSYDQKHAFKKWKKVLKGDANRVVSNLVNFIDEIEEKGKNRKEALETFEDIQKSIILKSEAVEKNDGKASYILRRMFKAYITNSHQLPDLGLKSILSSLVNKDTQKNLLQSEQKTFGTILDKLKKTMPDGSLKNDDLKMISRTNLSTFKTDNPEFESLSNGKSNEIKAALKKRKKLSVFYKDLKINNKNIIKFLYSDEEENNDNDNKKVSLGKNYIKKQLRELRAILDNPILNATPYWQSILTRGICDYIASLTDQEAVNEYEKLYSGLMELA